MGDTAQLTALTPFLCGSLDPSPSSRAASSSAALVAREPRQRGATSASGSPGGRGAPWGTVVLPSGDPRGREGVVACVCGRLPFSCGF